MVVFVTMCSVYSFRSSTINKMNRENKQLFTPNNHIDNDQFQTDTIHIGGYVDSIEGNTKINYKKIWSIILNNDQGRRVTIVFFEDLADMYSKLIHHRSIVTLINAFSRKCHDAYGVSQDNMHSIELVVRLSTNIILSPDIFNSIQPLECQLVDVFQQHSIKYVIAYVKSNFTFIEKRRCYYQSGVVTNGRFEVNVRILDSEVNPSITIGKLLIFSAEPQVDTWDYSCFLAVPKMSNVTVLDFTMSMENLELGILTPPQNLFYLL